MLLNIDWDSLKVTAWAMTFAIGISSWAGIGYGLTLLWEAL